MPVIDARYRHGKGRGLFLRFTFGKMPDSKLPHRNLVAGPMR